MEYYLVLAIEFKKYKKPARLTIHVGDNFVDTFDLDRDYTSTSTNIISQISERFYDEFGGSDNKWTKWLKERSTSIARLWKVYKLNGDMLQDKLTIKVENDNNDYTNGFMRMNSMIKFPLVALLKKNLVENQAEKLIKMLLKLKKAHEVFKTRLGMSTQDPLPLKKDGNVRSVWPYGDSFHVLRDNQTHGKSDVKDKDWWIGGSFTAVFPIKIKHRTKHLATPGHSTELGFAAEKITESQHLVFLFYKPLLNIYDENQ
jgi:hypothetical protein